MMATDRQNDSANGDGFAHDIRQKAIDAYGDARDGVSRAGRKASDGIVEAPLVALAGGFAVGALIASLLPRTRTESDYLQPLANRLKDNARTAADAAREAGSARLRELGLTPDAGKDVVRNVFEGVGDAAKTSAQAAIGTVKKS